MIVPTELKIYFGVMVYVTVGGGVLGTLAGDDEDVMHNSNMPLPIFIVMGWPIALFYLTGRCAYYTANRATKAILGVLK